MVKFGTFVFPNSIWYRVNPKIYSETPLPSANVSSRQYQGSLGYVIEVEGVITGTSQEVKDKINEMESLSDGEARTLDLESETPIFDAIMLEPSFERVRGFPNFVPYRVTIVQVLIEVGVMEVLRLDLGNLSVDYLG